MENNSTASSGSSKNVEKSQQTTRDDSDRSRMSPLELFVFDTQRYEQLSIGKRYTGSSAEQRLQDFDQKWQAASKRKD
ncbi:hypothetical protein F5Y04DRAFT_283228 [Hypomontagnella monticulosa]|nr:hypothetical protein F5Y04DRAFT_283228 [Hypomontagnella monticulosa]